MLNRLIYRLASLILFLLLCSGETHAGNWSAEQWASGGSVNEDRTTLTAEEAFKLDSFAIDEDHIRLVWQIAPGTYLYKERIQIRHGTSSSAALIRPDVMPKAGRKDDPEYGIVEVYRDRLELTVTVKPDVAQKDAPPITTLDVRYQGCADRGLCYPPVVKVLKLVMPVNTPTRAITVNTFPSSATSLILRRMALSPWQVMLAGGLTSLILARYLLSVHPAGNTKPDLNMQNVIVRASAWWLLTMGLIQLVRLITSP